MGGAVEADREGEGEGEVAERLLDAERDDSIAAIAAKMTRRTTPASGSMTLVSQA